MANWFGAWFGTEAAIPPSGERAFRLTLTDGDLSVNWMSSSGMELAADGWTMSVPRLKGGGVYGDSGLAHGRMLKHGRFDNVTDVFRFGFRFSSINDMIRQFSLIEELLMVRAPGYWQRDPRYGPVWLERQLDGESETAYYLVDYGFYDKHALVTAHTTPVAGALPSLDVEISRQPFVLGAAPGQVQKKSVMFALQQWNFTAAWAEETTLPSGGIFSFAELATGDIYAGGASEILLYSSGSWSAVSTAPVTLAEDVTAALLLANGDVLFGGNGRILKLSGGAWSEETTLPAGQVYSLIEASNGELFAADDGQILKRSSGGTWSVHNATLPAGQVYSLIEASNGRLYAGEAGRILRTAVVASGDTVTYFVEDGDDDAEEHDGSMDLDSNDLDLFRAVGDYSAMRFQLADIPKNAIIHAAKLRFSAREMQTSGTPKGEISAQLVASAPAIGTSKNYITNLTKTSAAVEWSGVGSWINGNKYDSPDFKAVVQELVSQASWAAGNRALLLVKGLVAGQRSASSRDRSAGEAPELIIEWSAALASTDTWELASTLPAGNVRSAVEVDGVLFFGDNGQIIASEDGDEFGVVTTLPTGEVRGMAADGSLIYAAGNGEIYKSADGGNTWALDSSILGGQGEAVLANGGTVRVGENGRIVALEPSSFSVGQEATVDNAVMVANHHKAANLTHVFRDDGGVLTNLYPAAAFPLQLFPAVAVVGDAVVAGIDSSLANTGPFSSLVFSLATPASATTSYTITAKYWNGASWATLTVHDGTSQLGAVGANAIAWQMPSDWSETAVSGVTGWWIRLELTALSGSFTSPAQGSRDVYAAFAAYAEIADDQAKGIVDSLARLHLTNRAGSLLKSGRFVIGTKPVEGHESFRAWLNLADTQNPDGVAVSIADGATTSFVDSLGAAAGRAVRFNASSVALNTLADRVKISLATTVARSFYGTYRLFVRGYQYAGSAGAVQLRWRVVSGSGGMSELTDAQVTASTSDHELIEFETTIQLPVSSQLTGSELGDETSLVLQIAASSSAARFDVYDIFLQPTNLAWADVQDTANSSTSAVGDGERLAIDSIGEPRVPIRAKSEKVATGLTKGSYAPESNGELRVLAQAQQRIWVLAAARPSAGSTVWASQPEMLHSIRGWQTDRFLTGRGAN